MPESGSDLPVILLSHGHGMANFLSSLNGYGPLANFWATHGFVVIQPTHLDSTALGLREPESTRRTTLLARPGDGHALHP